MGEGRHYPVGGHVTSHWPLDNAEYQRRRKMDEEESE